MASAFLPLKFTAKFRQEYKSIVTGKLKKGFGHLDYQFPGMLRFEMSKPTPLVFISRANQNWYYRPPFNKSEQGEVRKNVDGGHVITKFFDALSEGLEKNKFYNVSFVDKKQVEVLFNESSMKELGIKKAKLIFKSKDYVFTDLDRIEMNYVDKKMTTIIFENISLVDNFSRFNFKFSEQNPPKIRD